MVPVGNFVFVPEIKPQNIRFDKLKQAGFVFRTRPMFHNQIVAVAERHEDVAELILVHPQDFSV